MKTKTNQYNHKFERGWATVEFIILLPALMLTLLLTVHYGMMIYTKIALVNATHAAAQAMAKTDDCSVATEYFKANFNRPTEASFSCAGGTKVRYSASYLYAQDTIVGYVVPNVELKAESFAYSEKD
ncbi:MAG: TadE/TadG family type IV pilus assembly protein [Patescibacteria group bacterium]